MLLLDNSAWSRLLIAGALPEERTETIVEWIDEGEIGVCLPASRSEPSGSWPTPGITACRRPT